MPTIEEYAHLTQPAEEAWRRYGGFSSVGDWHPMLQSVEGEGNRRVAHGKDGSRQVEVMTGRSDKALHYDYIMEETAMPVANYEARFEIIPREDGSTARWVATFDVTQDDGGEAEETVRAFLRSGLDALKE